MREDEELLAWAFNDAQPFGTVGRLRFRVSHLTTAVLHPEGRMELAKHADLKSLTKFVKLHKPRLRLEPLPNEPGLPETWEPLGELVWTRLISAVRCEVSRERDRVVSMGDDIQRPGTSGSRRAPRAFENRRP